MTVPDRAVRARTRAGRLAFTERWVERFERGRLVTTPRVIDFGFGETPVTSLEWAEALNREGPGPPAVTVVAVERDEARAHNAKVHECETVRVVVGGFEVLPTLGPAAVVRAMNVLRAYPAHDVPDAHRALVSPLVDGGVVLEGSSDTEGHVSTFYVLRRRGLQILREALVFHTDFARGFSPWLFRDWLPRDVRRTVRPATPLHDFFERWHAAFERARGSADLTTRFELSAAGVADAELLEPGALQWRPPGGVPSVDPGQR